MTKSINFHNKAQSLLPGGVNSPVRAFRNVSSTPLYIESGSGSVLIDVDGNSYIDYVGAWGPHIIGHAHPAVINEIKKTIDNGLGFGAPSPLEVELAETIISMVPSVESIRFVNSGTEATMSAIRLARGYTGRERIVKFRGCYHGHADSFLIAAGSGALTQGRPDSPGVTTGVAKDTVIAEYNDLESVELLFSSYPESIAAIIVEPVAGNMGVVLPKTGFLAGLRELCDKFGALLIFDEVMTGFRVSPGGAQALYSVMPDLTTLGKIIGGGLPVGAYGGKKEIMNLISPEGPVYQAGTLSGNPVAMAAGLSVLRELMGSDIYGPIEKNAAVLEEGIVANLKEASVPGVVNRGASMMTLFFTKAESVTTYADAMTSDSKLFAEYFNKMLEKGIYLSPSQFEAFFLSAAHSKDQIDRTLTVQRKVFKEI